MFVFSLKFLFSLELIVDIIVGADTCMTFMANVVQNKVWREICTLESFDSHV